MQHSKKTIKNLVWHLEQQKRYRGKLQIAYSEPETAKRKLYEIKIELEK